MRGLREKTADFDLSYSDKLFKTLDLKNVPKNEKGLYAPFKNAEVSADFDRFEFDVVDGFNCETLESILDFKSKLMREKDRPDIEKIQNYLVGDRFKIGGIYKHYKGGLYRLEDTIIHSETGERMVAYRALYGENRLWCRPFMMFFEELDPKKYPNAIQKHRFELQDT